MIVSELHVYGEIMAFEQIAGLAPYNWIYATNKDKTRLSVNSGKLPSRDYFIKHGDGWARNGLWIKGKTRTVPQIIRRVYGESPFIRHFDGKRQ